MKELRMLIPPSDLPGNVAPSRPRIWQLIRWASLLLLATVICLSSSLSGSAVRYAGSLQLAAVLSAVGAVVLLIAAAVSYRRRRSGSLFPADSIADQDPPVLWSAGRHVDPK
jgi:hypothetical protein